MSAYDISTHSFPEEEPTPDPEQAQSEPEHDDEEYVLLTAEPGEEAQLANQLIKAAQKLYGPEKAAAMIRTNTDEGISFSVPVELAEAWEDSAGDDNQDEDEEFNPSEHSVAHVVAYLEDADETGEAQRVIEAERAGKGRKKILGWADHSNNDGE